MAVEKQKHKVKSSQHQDFYQETTETFPVTYAEIVAYFSKRKLTDSLLLRKHTIDRIVNVTQRPLVTYVANTFNSKGVRGSPSIDSSEITLIDELIENISGNVLDFLLVSNGGSIEAAERIVGLLREKFEHIRFILPGNAFSAATLIAFSGNEILMSRTSTLGPIDPQINGFPARTFVRGFENLDTRFQMNLLTQESFYRIVMLLEFCKSAEELSKELASIWLKEYQQLDPKSIEEVVNYFSNFDERKSHSRPVSRSTAKNLGLKINLIEEDSIELGIFVKSLYNQYLFFFDNTEFLKLYENSVGVHLGR